MTIFHKKDKVLFFFAKHMIKGGKHQKLAEIICEMSGGETISKTESSIQA